MDSNTSAKVADSVHYDNNHNTPLVNTYYTFPIHRFYKEYLTLFVSCESLHVVKQAIKFYFTTRNNLFFLFTANKKFCLCLNKIHPEIQVHFPPCICDDISKQTGLNKFSKDNTIRRWLKDFPCTVWHLLLGVQSKYYSRKKKEKRNFILKLVVHNSQPKIPKLNYQQEECVKLLV